MRHSSERIRARRPTVTARSGRTSFLAISSCRLQEVTPCESSSSLCLSSVLSGCCFWPALRRCQSPRPPRLQRPHLFPRPPPNPLSRRFLQTCPGRRGSLSQLRQRLPAHRFRSPTRLNRPARRCRRSHRVPSQRRLIHPYRLSSSRREHRRRRRHHPALLPKWSAAHDWGRSLPTN